MSLRPTDVGHRVVVRRILSGADADRPQYGDVLGELIELDAERQCVVVRTSAGDVTVPVTDVMAAKRIPPKRIRDLELERIAALGWRGLDTERLGDWQLRAAGGWTGRANSVLPLGDPGVPLDAALEHVTEWYARRDLPPTIQVPLPAMSPLRDELEARGWTDAWGAVVLVAEVSGSPEPHVRITDEPDDAWLAAYHYRGAALPEVAVRVLKNAEKPGFASLEQHGETVAICRLAVDEGWVGITAVEVDPAHRRRGLARRLMAGALTWAAEQGARNAYLQTEPENTAALSLYEQLGFRRHHTYRYYRR